MGPPGAGKTDVLTTYIEAEIELFVLITEPGGAESLLDACARRKLDISKLHWTTVQPAAEGLTALDDMVKTVANNSFEDIQKIKSGVGKDKTREPAMKLLKSLKNFVCERDGKDYGSYFDWSADRAFALDSMSGCALIAMALTIGYKPAAHQGEWGVAMNFLEQLMLNITSNRRCFLTVTAHVEKELNQITGVQQIMASTLGAKLSPKLPRFFSEVVLAKRTLDEKRSFRFTWSTVEANADLKNRALEAKSEINPSFVPIVNVYKQRLNSMQGEVVIPNPPTAKPQPTLTQPLKPTGATT